LPVSENSPAVRVVKALKYAGVSGKDFLARHGRDKNALKEWRDGRTLPVDVLLETLRTCAEAGKPVSPSWLLADEGEMVPPSSALKVEAYDRIAAIVREATEAASVPDSDTTVRDAKIERGSRSRRQRP